MKLIPLEKQSERAQKAHHDKQRGSWNGVVPVTRLIPNKKAYDRSRAKRADRSFQASEGWKVRSNTTCKGALIG